MPGWKGIVGTSYTAEEFDVYCHQLQWTAWRPSFLVVHNTASPTLAQRSTGFKKHHIKNSRPSTTTNVDGRQARISSSTTGRSGYSHR